MTTIPDPNSWMDVFTILAATAMVAIPSWFAARNHKSIKQVSEDTRKLDKSISNGHDYPLRTDVDEIRETLKDIRGDMKGLKSDVSDIRSEIRQERKDRLELDDRFERYKKTS
jgi:chromosome segregation ATPase